MERLYLLLEIIAALYQHKTTQNWLAVFPNIFVLNGFLWYFYVFVGKVLAKSKEDSNYSQAVMIAFSVFFLLINIENPRQQLAKESGRRWRCVRSVQRIANGFQAAFSSARIGVCKQSGA